MIQQQGGSVFTARLRLPTFSQVYALKMEIAVLLAAANRCPPVLKQHSPHTLMASSFTSLLHSKVVP